MAVAKDVPVAWTRSRGEVGRAYGDVLREVAAGGAPVNVDWAPLTRALVSAVSHTRAVESWAFAEYVVRGGVADALEMTSVDRNTLARLSGYLRESIKPIDLMKARRAGMLVRVVGPLVVTSGAGITGLVAIMYRLYATFDLSHPPSLALSLATPAVGMLTFSAANLVAALGRSEIEAARTVHRACVEALALGSATLRPAERDVIDVR